MAVTLAGFAVAPVFAGVVALQTKPVVRCEAFEGIFKL